VYAGAASGGVWRSIDGGLSWKPTMHHQDSQAIGALGISTSNPEILYAATGEGVTCFQSAFGGVGVYKTRNSGTSWDLLAPLPSVRCTRVLIHPASPDWVYVAGNAGLHFSANGGASWVTLREGYVSDALMDPRNPAVIYAAVWHRGVYKSVDGGNHWTLLSGGLPTGGPADWIKLAMGENGAHGTSFLLAKMGHNSGTVYRSLDAGETWDPLPGTLEPNAYNGWATLVAVSPHNEDILFVGGIRLQRSIDAGKTFEEVTVHHDLQAMVFARRHRKVCYVATDGGVFRSDNSGGCWTPCNNGLVTTQFYSLGVAQTLPFVIGGATQDRGILVGDGTGKWEKVLASEGGFFVVDPNDSKILYSRPAFGFLKRQVRGGDWVSLPIIPGIAFVEPTVEHLAIQLRGLGNDYRLLCGHGDGVFLSLDQGTTWKLVLDTEGIITRVAFSPSDPAICYATTSKGQVWRNKAGGDPDDWTMSHGLSLGPPRASISALVIGWNNPDVLYIAGGCEGAHIYRSLNGGVDWANADGVDAARMRDHAPVNALVQDDLFANTVYAATDRGVFRTSDRGDSWERYDENLPRVPVKDLVLQREHRLLYAATFGRGVYVLKLP
jgi:photosystem II stability/assembly factor-like uncharacterized protein